MSRAMSVRVNEEISLSLIASGKVHMNLNFHLGAGHEVFFTQAVLMPPAVARRLGEALIELAAHAAAPAVAS